jgi:hypothetical protein
MSALLWLADCQDLPRDRGKLPIIHIATDWRCQFRPDGDYPKILFRMAGIFVTLIFGMNECSKRQAAPPGPKGILKKG